MDVILARAGLNAPQQRAVCFGAVRDEVRQTESRLADALASLKRLQDVVRVARDIHKTQREVATLLPDTEASIERIAHYSEPMVALVRGIQTVLSTFTVPRGASGCSAEEEEEEVWSQLNQETTQQQEEAPFARVRRGPNGEMIYGAVPADCFSVRGHETPREFSRGPRTDSSFGAARAAAKLESIGQKRRATSPPPSSDHSFLRPTTGPVLFPTPEMIYRREAERKSIWPRLHQYRLLNSRPRSPVQQSEKKVAQVVDGLKRRLSKLPPKDQGGAFSTCIESALKIARLTQVKGEEASVQEAMDNAMFAANGLLEGSSPYSDDRLEDLRQTLMVVVRAVLETSGNLEGSGLRNLMDIIKKLQDVFPDAAARFKWCSTQLRKFVLQKYERPVEISRVDQKKLALVVDETRRWESVNECTASRFGDIMIFVTEVLEGSYAQWEPREDTSLAELIGVMIIRLGAFKDTHVQQKRLLEVNGWLYKMSGTSFTPTLDLEAETRPQTSGVYLSANSGFHSQIAVEDGFDRISKANSTKSFGFLTMTLCTFLATVTLTRDQNLLPINQLGRLNENLQALKELDVDVEHWAVLQSYQELEKILYLMRVLMKQRPEYVESSISTINTLVSLFPPSKRPTFAYPSNAAPSKSNSMSTLEALDNEPSDD